MQRLFTQVLPARVVGDVVAFGHVAGGGRNARTRRPVPDRQRVIQLDQRQGQAGAALAFQVFVLFHQVDGGHDVGNVVFDAAADEVHDFMQAQVAGYRLQRVALQAVKEMLFGNVGQDDDNVLDLATFAEHGVHRRRYPYVAAAGVAGADFQREATGVARAFVQLVQDADIRRIPRQDDRQAVPRHPFGAEAEHVAKSTVDVDDAEFRVQDGHATVGFAHHQRQQADLFTVVHFLRNVADQRHVTDLAIHRDARQRQAGPETGAIQPFHQDLAAGADDLVDAGFAVVADQVVMRGTDVARHQHVDVTPDHVLARAVPQPFRRTVEEGYGVVFINQDNTKDGLFQCRKDGYLHVIYHVAGHRAAGLLLTGNERG